MKTDVFSSQWKKTSKSSGTVEIVSADEFALELKPEKYVIKTKPICWVVAVDAVIDNVEEEGKWLIDVAVSYLRLWHPWHGPIPEAGRVEAHPTRATSGKREGIKIREGSVLAGGMSVPGSYAIDSTVVATSKKQQFIAQAELIFAPPQKSLAQRVSQGLGWLTRGRQAEDRAERFLYFFTAIEALLSHDDKSAPVTQTIARHAAVLLTNKMHERVKIGSDIKKLYTFRSGLIHAGARSILWSEANRAQILAEGLFVAALRTTNLAIEHQTFCEELGKASYGLQWPVPVSTGGPK